MALSPKNQERVDNLKKRVKTLAVAASKGWKGTAIETVGGAVSYYALGAIVEKVEWLQEHWWATPAALIIGGHFAKRKPSLHGVGSGLVFLGGFLGAQGYDQESSDETTEEGKGFRAGDAGGWGMLDGGEAGAMQQDLPAPNLTRSLPGGALQQPMPAANAGELVGVEAYGLSD